MASKAEAKTVGPSGDAACNGHATDEELDVPIAISGPEDDDDGDGEDGDVVVGVPHESAGGANGSKRKSVGGGGAFGGLQDRLAALDIRRPLSAGAMTAPPPVDPTANPFAESREEQMRMLTAGGGRRGRQRTLSTSATVSTEREPIIRTSKRTIYTAGRPPWYDSQGQHVVCAILSIFPESQQWNRENIANYCQVYIDAPMDSLVARDSKGLYKRAMNGELKDVAG